MNPIHGMHHGQGNPHIQAAAQAAGQAAQAAQAAAKSSAPQTAASPPIDQVQLSAEAQQAVASA